MAKRKKAFSIEELRNGMSESAKRLNGGLFEGGKGDAAERKMVTPQELSDKMWDRQEELCESLYASGVTPIPVFPKMPEPKPATLEKCIFKCLDARKRLDSINKTERRYYDAFLLGEVMEDGLVVFIQPTRLFELEGGGTYTPDFVAVRDYGLEVIEIKGGYRGHGWEQGIERYRRVAAQYDCDRIRFKMAEWNRKKMQWEITEWKDRI